MAREWAAQEALVEQYRVGRTKVGEGSHAHQARRSVGLVDAV